MLCRFALVKENFGRVRLMLSPLGPSRFSCEVRVLFGLSEPTRLRPLRNLFIAFGIAERAVQSTINQFSEDSLRAKGDIHQLVRDLIRRQSRAAGEAGEEICWWTRSTSFPRRRPREDIPPGCAFRGRRDNVSLPQNMGTSRGGDGHDSALWKMEREVVPRLGDLRPKGGWQVCYRCTRMEVCT